MTIQATAPRVLVNWKQGVTHEDSVARMFPNGVPLDNATLVAQASLFFDLGPGALSGYSVTREANGNVLIRPEAVFGSKRFAHPDYKLDDGIQAIIALQAMVGIHETKRAAEHGWRRMTADERKMTLMAYEAIHGKKKAKATV